MRRAVGGGSGSNGAGCDAWSPTPGGLTKTDALTSLHSALRQCNFL